MIKREVYNRIIDYAIKRLCSLLHFVHNFVGEYEMKNIVFHHSGEMIRISSFHQRSIYEREILSLDCKTNPLFQWLFFCIHQDKKDEKVESQTNNHNHRNQSCKGYCITFLANGLVFFMNLILRRMKKMTFNSSHKSFFVKARCILAALIGKDLGRMCVRVVHRYFSRVKNSGTAKVYCGGESPGNSTFHAIHMRIFWVGKDIRFLPLFFRLNMISNSVNQ